MLFQRVLRLMELEPAPGLQKWGSALSFYGKKAKPFWSADILSALRRSTELGRARLT